MPSLKLDDYCFKKVILWFDKCELNEKTSLLYISTILATFQYNHDYESPFGTLIGYIADKDEDKEDIMNQAIDYVYAEIKYGPKYVVTETCR